MPGPRRLTGAAPMHGAGTAVLRSDGRRLATIGPDGELRVWDTTQPGRTSLVTRLRRRRRIVAAAWNAEAADLLATLSIDGGVVVWRIVDDRPPHPVWGVDRRLPHAAGLAWLPDGRHLACVSRYGDVVVWDSVWGVCRARIAGRATTCLAMSPGPDALRMAYSDGVISLVPLRGPGIMPASASIPPIMAACWSGHGELLAVAGQTGFVGMLDAQLRVICGTESGPGEPPVFGWAGDARLVVADQSAGTLAAVDTSGHVRWRIPMARTVTSLSAAGDMVAVGGRSTAPLIVDLDRGALLFPV